MRTEVNQDLVRRAAVHNALGDPARLSVVDSLLLGDAAPSELQALLAMPSNLLAHHVGVLQRAGVIRRSRSHGDRRRTYLSLVPDALDALRPVAPRRADRVVFVCTQNSARSQLAVALWTCHSDVATTSAGTHPAPAVHSGAVAAARRHDLPLQPMTPCRLGEVMRPGDLVVTVCDNAHEELQPDPAWLHWSIPDPARSGEDAAFDQALAGLTDRISRLTPALTRTTT